MGNKLQSEIEQSIAVTKELKQAVEELVLKEDWNESLHPRADDGKFTSGGGAAAGTVKKIVESVSGVDEPHFPTKADMDKVRAADPYAGMSLTDKPVPGTTHYPGVPEKAIKPKTIHPVGSPKSVAGYQVLNAKHAKLTERYNRASDAADRANSRAYRTQSQSAKTSAYHADSKRNTAKVNLDNSLREMQHHPEHEGYVARQRKIDDIINKGNPAPLRRQIDDIINKGNPAPKPGFRPILPGQEPPKAPKPQAKPKPVGNPFSNPSSPLYDKNKYGKKVPGNVAPPSSSGMTTDEMEAFYRNRKK